jgi:hypothetical protein
MERPMQKLNDLSRSPSPLDPDGTLIAVIELSLSSWLVAGIVPGVERQPCAFLFPAVTMRNGRKYPCHCFVALNDEIFSLTSTGRR